MPVYLINGKSVLFLHIPKTAGMAIDAHLSEHFPVAFNTRVRVKVGVFGPRHQPAAVLKTIFLDQMIDYAFMVVRHPVARLVSEYRYQHRHNAFQRLRLGLMGFDLWLKFALLRTSRAPAYRGNHFRPQIAYECFGCEVFKYEDGLKAVMQGVSRATGVEIPYETRARNVSHFRSVSISQKSLDLIAQTYEADFQRFGYEVCVPDLTGVRGPK